MVDLIVVLIKEVTLIDHRTGIGADPTLFFE